MRRRNFIALLGGAAAVWPLAARAQQSERMRRTGVRGYDGFAQAAAAQPSARLLGRSTRFQPHHAGIVFVTVADPVGGGFVESLARPGGNATGFTVFEYAIGAL